MDTRTITTSRETEDEAAMWDALHDPESPFYRCALDAEHTGDCCPWKPSRPLSDEQEEALDNYEHLLDCDDGSCAHVVHGDS